LDRARNQTAPCLQCFAEPAEHPLSDLVHVAGHNLGILMRLLIGAGTPKEAAGRPLAYLLFVYTDEAVTIILVAASPDRSAIPGFGRYRLPRLLNAGLRQRAVRADPGVSAR
jgi:hypothetical protein